MSEQEKQQIRIFNDDEHNRTLQYVPLLPAMDFKEMQVCTTALGHLTITIITKEGAELSTFMHFTEIAERCIRRVGMEH